MVSDKAMYWLAVAVLAMVAGNSLVTRHSDWVSSLNDRSLDVAQRVTDRAMAMAGRSGDLRDHANDGLTRGQIAAVRVQTRLASIQSRLASRQAAMARLEAQKVRAITINGMRYKLDCPPENVTVDVDAPEIEVDDSN